MSAIPPKSNSTDFVRVDFFGSPATYDEMDYASLKPFSDKDVLLCNNTGACDSKYKQVIIEAETHYKWLAGEMDDTTQISDSAANQAMPLDPVLKAWLDGTPAKVSNIVLPAVHNLAHLKAKWLTQRKLPEVDLTQWQTEDNKSGYRGVSCRINGKFEAFSAASGKRVYVGAFQTAQAAARAVALDSLNCQGSREETPHAAGIQSVKTSVRSENVYQRIPAATALAAMGFSSEVTQAALAAAGNSLELALDLALASDIVPRPVSSRTHKNRHRGQAAVVNDDTDMVEGFIIQSSAAAPDNVLHPWALCRVLKGCLVSSGFMDRATRCPNQTATKTDAIGPDTTRCSTAHKVSPDWITITKRHCHNQHNFCSSQEETQARGIP